jgi:hypothetical protein
MRKVFICDIDGKASDCKDFLQRNSEDRLIFSVISNTSVKNEQINSEENKHKLLYLVPFLNQYQGTVLVVESTFESKIDIDIFFNHKELNNLGPRVYFVNHNAWIIDCHNDSNLTLTPFYIEETDRFKLKESFPFETVDSI